MNISELELEKSEEELLLVLADELIASGEIKLSGPLDDNGKRERARRWLNSFRLRLKGSICGDPRVIAYLQDPSKQTRVDIAGVVVDCLTATGIGVPVGTLAVLIVKGQLQTLCA